MVDSYSISYTSTHDQCIGPLDSTSHGSLSGINGSMRSYTLTNLVENSSYMIDVEAINRAGSESSDLKIRTLEAGMLNNTISFIALFGQTIWTRCEY